MPIPKKRISQRSKTLVASLLLAGFKENPKTNKHNSNYYYLFNETVNTPLMFTMAIAIHKAKAKYKISYFDNFRIDTSIPIKPGSLKEILFIAKTQKPEAISEIRIK